MNEDKDSEMMLFTNCPICNSTNITRETKNEHTGGGFSDSWDEYVLISIDCQLAPNDRSNF
ncbi:MAG: hypothetical protein ACW99A_13420 [Candidatus Kariarchaeaceae archaeon]|jgi:hypothetical protein